MSTTPSKRNEGIDAVIDAARSNVGIDAVWNLDREVRVREGAVRRHEQRERRHRALRRGALIASGAGLLVLALLARVEGAPASAASAGPGAPSVEGTASAPASTGTSALALAATSLNDAGYARD